MAINSVQPLSSGLPALRSLVGRAAPSLQKLAEHKLELKIVDQRSLLADVQDDMAALLSSVLRRQASRRADKAGGQDNNSNVGEEVAHESREEDVARVRALLLDGAGWRATYDLARALFPDPTELALLLAGLREDEELDETTRAEVEKALAALVSEHGQEPLAASINIRQVIASFGTRTNLTPDSLRQAYLSLLNGGYGEAVTYRYLIDTFGFARRGQILDFLEQALAADMAAATPSKSADDYSPLLNLLFQLRLLRSADALLMSAAGQNRQRERRRDRRSAHEKAEVDPMDTALIDLLLSALTDFRKTREQFEQFLKRWHAVAPQKQVAAWAHSVLRAMGTIPVELFPDLVYREALIANLSDAIESLFHQDPTGGSRLGQRYV